MIDSNDPPRLFDPASGAPAGLRNLIGAAQKDVGSDLQVARLAERLGPLLAPPAVPAPHVAASAAGLGTLAKLGLAGVALLVAGGGALLFSAPKSAPPSAPIKAAPSLAPQTVAPSVSPAPAPAPATVDVPAPATPAPEVSGAVKPATKAAPVAQLSEAELLEQARKSLKSDPSRALARANEHRSRFPGGALVQEREVIAIKALRQLGRTAEADSRADAFAKAFPGSAFQRKLKLSP